MGLKEYEFEVDGMPHTVQLTEEDAKARGLTEKVRKPAADKARKPSNKAAKPAADK